jgi:hypothetical protein
MAQPSATDQIISAGRQMLLKHNCVCCDRKTPQIHIAPSAAFDKVKDYLLWNQQIILNLNTSYWQLKQPILALAGCLFSVLTVMNWKNLRIHNKNELILFTDESNRRKNELIDLKFLIYREM